jgi:hypothetical protein
MLKMNESKEIFLLKIKVDSRLQRIDNVPLLNELKLYGYRGFNNSKNYQTKMNNVIMIHINMKEKGRGFALRSVLLALSLSPLPGPFSHKKGGMLAKI